MKILCSYSSLEFTCEHFPASLYSSETSHPIFSLPQKKLLSYAGKWASGTALTPTDSYLLFLATLKSTDLVHFRVPAIRTIRTPAIVAQNMENLFLTVSRLNTVQNPAVCFPTFVISPETKDLSNICHWLINWNEAFEDFKSGKRREYDNHKLLHRESALQRLIKNPHRTVASIAPSIAEWASIAGSFPEFALTNPFTGSIVLCSDYWKLLIIKCANEESLFSIARKDLEELLEHCEENISHGTIYANALFKILRHALERQKNFLGLGDMDIHRSTYEILTSTDNVEDANIRAMIQSAPEHEPRAEEYPTKFLFMKAKLRWDMAKKFIKETPTDSSKESDEESEGESE